MGRTPQTSIRFDPAKLDLIKKREGLQTVQKVVDYLVDAYWWQHKLNPASKNGPTTEYEAFEEQIKGADAVEIVELVKWHILRSKSLSNMDKRVLMETAGEKINKLK